MLLDRSTYLDYDGFLPEDAYLRFKNMSFSALKVEAVRVCDRLGNLKPSSFQI